MFGDKRLYKKLAASGLKAPAEVTAVKEGHIASVSQPGVTGTKEWRVSVTVRPEGEMPFSATIVREVELGGTVLIGTILSVLYDPNDHAKVMEEQGLSGAIDKMAAQLGSKPVRPAAKPKSGVAAETTGDSEAAGSGDAVTRLTQLADLRDRGVLSTEEYETEKARILGGGN